MLFEGLIGLPLTGIMELPLERVYGFPCSPGLGRLDQGNGLLRPLLTSGMVIIRIKLMIR